MRKYAQWAGRAGTGMTMGAAVLMVGLAGSASAASPTQPTAIEFSVSPPNGVNGVSDDPVTINYNTSEVITADVYSSGSDDTNAPSGTVTFSDSAGVIPGCSAVALGYYNLILSDASCTVTFPSSAPNPDVITMTYSGGPAFYETSPVFATSSTTETLDFAATPPAATPEAPEAVLLPISGLGVIGAAGVWATRRRRRRAA